MNSPPKLPSTTNPRGHPTEFDQIIQEKSRNFVGRNFVFTAINEFLQCYSRGYFTIIGAPGSGKSAILAKYVTENPHVVYYNTEFEGKNLADEFLRNICTQLINQYSLNYNSLPDNATEGSWFLSSLLQQISEKLELNQKIIIAIDALNCIDHNSQPLGTNLFYLPRYLPDGVYFLLTRRPFLREKSGLLIETPSQSLDLADFSEENRQDVQAYIEKNLTPLPPLPYEGRGEQKNFSPLLKGEGLEEGSNIKRLIAECENNFMYLSQIINAINEGFYSEGFDFHQLPPGLEAYYQQHLQKMLDEAKEDFSIAVLNVLIQQQKAISTSAIAHIIDADEYDVEQVLENWFEFLHQQRITEENYYSLYHSSFRHWLTKQQIL
ncbi:ATP-binding protein [Nostoc sp. CENA67]|uniref:ATP-binding protein n=1 Tax=Amazonocrinis nigriterrae CENA67 TaxID=2794033 RepID=A0A8J7HK54_9NOST|nr:ATP-binding protein [Amazonocrinis nigriterrae]MBH8560998.1 ATP-binding protein [Amazonocrinis nigriterrae CENA67]